MGNRQFDHDSEVIQSDDVGYKKPGRYSVIMHNDNYTTMDFVIKVLVSVFNHSEDKATALMQTIHNRGKANVGTYSFEIAETKAAQTMTMAKNEGYPLKCTLKAE
jgi:ATP-dependent Clp protease adaptor protein ClpS